MSTSGIYGLSGSGIDVDSMVKVGMLTKQNQYDKMYKKRSKRVAEGSIRKHLFGLEYLQDLDDVHVQDVVHDESDVGSQYELVRSLGHGEF